MIRIQPSASVFLLPLIVACGGQSDAEKAPSYTWHRDASSVIVEKCAGCHVDGGIAPFSLTTHAEVAALTGPIENSISSGSMPPWQGGDDCNSYSNDFSLAPTEKEMLLAWLEQGAVEGDPKDAPAATETPEAFALDVELVLPEPYTPVMEPDDYRCQLIEWPLEETSWITGFRVVPDQTSIVHHTIVFAVGADDIETYREMDAADPAPGYTCFGSPSSVEGIGESQDLEDLTLPEMYALLESGELDGFGGIRWIGGWVPGAPTNPAPEGTGLRMEPGDLVIVQMHYNTQSAAPVADQSMVGFQVASSVEREATMVPFTDPGWVTGLDLLGGPMYIPSGASDVYHETVIEGNNPYFGVVREELGLPDGAPLEIHSAAHHMHLLGATGSQRVRHATGEETCLVDIPNWDFGWQGGFDLEKPVVFREEDSLVLGCSWDNSPENQPIVEGQAQTTQDVVWGEGSTDEMCLATFYVTGQ